MFYIFYIYINVYCNIKRLGNVNLDGSYILYVVLNVLNNLKMFL